MGKKENSPKIIFSVKNRYKEMPYKKKYTGRRTKKTLKRGGSYKKRAIRAAKTKSLVRLIKSVSLKSCETKNTHQIEENINLYHNVQELKTNLMYTRQGIGDANTGLSSYSSRIGDEIVARGLQFKFWFANKSSRPNVMYKIIIFKYYSQSTPPSTIFKGQGTANLMIRDIDTEKLKIVKVKMFNLQVGASQTPTDGQNINYGKEAHKYMKVYVPLSNAKIKYIADDSGTPRNYDYGFCVIAYDSYGTLTTDNIASYAYNVKFYFKDP